MTLLRAASPWLVAVLLMLAFALSFIDRQILAFMVGPIRRDLGISDTQMSLLMGFSFAIIYAAATLPLGRLADRSNRRNLIIGGVLFWSLMTAACGLARNYTQLFIARFGVGAGEAALQPAAYSLIAASFPPERRALAMSVCSAGVYIGSGVAFLLGGLMAQAIATHPTVTLPLLGTVFGWQAVLIALGAVGVVLAALLLFIREPARATQQTLPPVGEVARLWWGQRRILLPHHLGFAALMLCSYGTSAWMPAYFTRVHGYAMVEIGLLMGLSAMTVGVLGMLLGGWLCDRWQARHGAAAVYRLAQWSIAGVLLFGGSYMLMPSGFWAGVCVLPAVFAISLTVGAAPASVQGLVPEAMRGQASAVYLTLINLVGLGLGPTAVALLTDRVFGNDQAVGQAMFVVTVVAMALAWGCLRVAARRVG